MERQSQERIPLLAPQRPPKKAPEGLLLFMLVMSVLITVASMILARRPAASLFAPITENELPKGHSH